MSQSFMQDSLTALILLHLHQQLGQVIAQEVLLLGLQGRFIVIYCLCDSSLVSTLFFFFCSESELCLSLYESMTQTLT